MDESKGARLTEAEREAINEIKKAVDEAAAARASANLAARAAERAGLDGCAVADGMDEAWRRLDDAMRALRAVIAVIEGRV